MLCTLEIGVFHVKLTGLDLAILVSDRLVQRTQELASDYVAYTDALLGKRAGAIDPVDQDETAKRLLSSFARFMLCERAMVVAVTTDLLAEDGILADSDDDDWDF